jgi:hypothetical protein
MGRWGTRGPLWGLGAVGRWGDGEMGSVRGVRSVGGVRGVRESITTTNY